MRCLPWFVYEETGNVEDMTDVPSVTLHVWLFFSIKMCK